MELRQIGVKVASGHISRKCDKTYYMGKMNNQKRKLWRSNRGSHRICQWCSSAYMLGPSWGWCNLAHWQHRLGWQLRFWKMKEKKDPSILHVDLRKSSNMRSLIAKNQIKDSTAFWDFFVSFLVYNFSLKDRKGHYLVLIPLMKGGERLQANLKFEVW